MSRETILIMHDIRSTHNVGAIFRTAEAVGINKIYLTGYTPAPIDRFNRKRKDIAKASLGAEEMVPWEHSLKIFPVLNKLKKAGFFFVAIEQSKDSVDYKKVSARGGPAFGWKKLVFIVGTEVSGIPKNILDKCDIIAEIPMQGRKESLNVSVAFGVAIFRILGV